MDEYPSYYDPVACDNFNSGRYMNLIWTVMDNTTGRNDGLRQMIAWLSVDERQALLEHPDFGTFLAEYPEFSMIYIQKLTSELNVYGLR